MYVVQLFPAWSAWRPWSQHGDPDCPMTSPASACPLIVWSLQRSCGSLAFSWWVWEPLPNLHGPYLMYSDSYIYILYRVYIFPSSRHIATERWSDGDRIKQQNQTDKPTPWQRLKPSHSPTRSVLNQSQALLIAHHTKPGCVSKWTNSKEEPCLG